jgi:CTP:molybdopterin cytidylyltransferase MocA
MGKPKGLLEIAGETFVQRVVRALADGGCDPVYVVIAEGDAEVGALARRAGARVLPNPDPGEGPITSLRVALGAVAPSVAGVVYLPLDHALVESGHVSRLLDAAHRSRATLALPVHGAKRGHPAFFRRSLFDELLDPDLEGGARTVVHRHLDSACLLPFDDPAVVTDIDTPEAYAEALRTHAAAPGPDPS